jgi:cytochrome c biogenesis protein
VSEPVDPRRGEGLWRALISLRLTLALFLILAAASVIGTLIPQNLPPEQYVRTYGAVAARIFDLLRITDLFHSAWFLSLLGALAVHITACSLKRLPATWKALKAPQRPLSDALLRSVPVKRLMEGDNSPHVVESVRAELARAGWKPSQERVGEVLHLMAQRGRWSRLGAYVAHTGVLLVLLGAAMGFAFGFKGFVQIQEGEVVDRVQERGRGTWRQLGFQVRCDRFQVTSYPDGTPKEYRSDLVFLKDGKVAMEGPLRVNHPINFGGYVFYQASYGASATVTLEARKDSSTPPRQMVMELGDTASLDPQGRVIVKLLRYESDLQGRGPAVLLTHFRPEAPPVTGWVFQRDSKAVLEGWNLRLLGARETRWTGLQVKQDPGVWVVWVGSFLIMAGCAMAFLGVHRRLWVRMEPRNKRLLCWVAASSTRDLNGLGRALDGICQAWQAKAGLGWSGKEARNG